MIPFCQSAIIVRQIHQLLYTVLGKGCAVSRRAGKGIAPNGCNLHLGQGQDANGKNGHSNQDFDKGKPFLVI
jgi:hypothetical protein